MDLPAGWKEAGLNENKLKDFEERVQIWLWKNFWIKNSQCVHLKKKASGKIQEKVGIQIFKSSEDMILCFYICRCARWHLQNTVNIMVCTFINVILSFHSVQIFRYLSSGCTQYFLSKRSEKSVNPASLSAEHRAKGALVDAIIDDVIGFQTVDQDLGRHSSKTPLLMKSSASIL